jgi:hypothetical protein
VWRPKIRLASFWCRLATERPNDIQYQILQKGWSSNTIDSFYLVIRLPMAPKPSNPFMGKSCLLEGKVLRFKVTTVADTDIQNQCISASIGLYVRQTIIS